MLVARPAQETVYSLVGENDSFPFLGQTMLAAADISSACFSDKIQRTDEGRCFFRFNAPIEH